MPKFNGKKSLKILIIYFIFEFTISNIFNSPGSTLTNLDEKYCFKFS